jgi:D-arabinose 1-dehydrogenase-like Zn-dependent alcohol dehydrogenase
VELPTPDPAAREPLLCERAKFTGLDTDGGYAQFACVPADCICAAVETLVCLAPVS